MYSRENLKKKGKITEAQVGMQIIKCDKYKAVMGPEEGQAQQQGANPRNRMQRELEPKLGDVDLPIQTDQQGMDGRAHNWVRRPKQLLKNYMGEGNGA